MLRIPLVLLLSVIPYLVGFYGLVFANAFPDWVSVGLTRYILTRASQSKMSISFAMWLVLDIASALFCLLSNLIVSVAMSASYVAVLLDQTQFLRIKVPASATDELALLFRRSLALSLDLVSVFDRATRRLENRSGPLE
ncbi:MAG: hypothetical protein WDN03_02200 [Rhizomicrobium sp.]